MRRGIELRRRTAARIRWARWRWAAPAVVLGLLAGGCQTMRPRSAAAPPAVPTDSNAALVEYIADQPYLTVEPAYRALYALRHGEAFSGDFAALTEALKAERIVPSSWQHPADALLDRASAGLLICRAANVRTGLNWRLTGSGRYAWRELHYQGIVAPISEYGYIPGGQFVGILARTEDYLRRTGPDAGAPLELGREP